MTMIGNNFMAGFRNTAGMAGAAMRGAGTFSPAAGIAGSRFHRLEAGPFAQPMLPRAVNVTLGRLIGSALMPLPAKAAAAPAKEGGAALIPLAEGPGPQRLVEPAGRWTASLTGQNTARIDLGDGYRLAIDERNSEMTIFNDKTGERTRVWGDPHVEIDGKQAYDFWGTTTFTLENGTKLTINTEQWKGNPNMYVASQVVITKGEQAIVIDGISQNKLGDLSISQSNRGHALDSAHRDGFVLHENATGAGWRSEWTGEVATQKDLDVTRVGAAYGPGSEAPSLDETSNAIGLFLVSNALASFVNFMSMFNFVSMVGGGGTSNNSARAEEQPQGRPGRRITFA